MSVAPTGRPGTGNNTRFHDGWLEHKGSPQAGSGWTSLWLVLKGGVIYIFKNQQTSPENQIGNLTVDESTGFVIKEHDPKKGYRFDLKTGKFHNKFRSKKLTERELWRAYIIGISKRRVPDDLDLIPEKIQSIKDEIFIYFNAPLEDRPLPAINVGTNRRSLSDESGVVPDFQGESGSVASSNSGGPIVRHRFYPNRDREDIPMWFFSSCTRDRAEEILYKGAAFGNILMRQSTTFKDSGSYVISVMVIQGGTPLFEHYEVLRNAEGYKINVSNQHMPMKCLTEVMDYFIQTAGPSMSKPMATNNLQVLGIKQVEPDYQSRIGLKANQKAESWSWPPPDYDEKYEEPTQKQRQPHKTYTPPSYRHDKTIYDRQSGSRNTIAVGRSKPQRPNATPEVIAERVQSAEQLDVLDNAISGFDDSEYYNEDLFVEAHQSVVSPPRQQDWSSTPPPPPPHSTGSYVNENLENSQSASAFLPPAPPVPKHVPPEVKPLQSPAPSIQQCTPALGQQRSPHQFVSPALSSPPSLNQISSSPSTSHANIRHSASFPASPQPQQWASTPSTKGPGYAVPNKGINRQSSEPEVVTAKVSDDVQAGVDENTPGNVKDLLSKFNQSMPGQNAEKQSAPKTPKAQPNWKKQNTQKTMTPEEAERYVDELYEDIGLDEDLKTNQSLTSYTTNSPYANQISRHSGLMVNARTARVHSNTGGGFDDDVYDDTAPAPDTFIGKRKVTFEEPPTGTGASMASSAGGPRGMRRASEPAINKPEGVVRDETFKRMLEAKLSGVSNAPGIARTLPVRPVSQELRNSQQLSQDDMYEAIPADEVYYANEKYNTED